MGSNGVPASSVPSDAVWPLVQAIKSREMVVPGQTDVDALPDISSTTTALIDDGQDNIVINTKGKGGKRSFHQLLLDENVPSFFRRLCWSPDGSLLYVPTGMYKTFHSSSDTSKAVSVDIVPTTYVFARDHLSVPLCHYPGTKQTKPSVVVRCSPVLYKFNTSKFRGSSSLKESSEEQKNIVITAKSEQGSSYLQALANLSQNNAFVLPYRIITAIATLDSVHIYDSQYSQPILTISGYHLDKITDVAWYVKEQYIFINSFLLLFSTFFFFRIYYSDRSPSGNMLFISSWDGYISCVLFPSGELGDVLPLSEQPPLLVARAEAINSAYTSMLESKIDVPIVSVPIASDGQSNSTVANVLQPRKRISLAPTSVSTSTTIVPILQDADTKSNYLVNMVGGPPIISSQFELNANNHSDTAERIAVISASGGLRNEKNISDEQNKVVTALESVNKVRPQSTPERPAIAASNIGSTPRRRITPIPSVVHDIDIIPSVKRSNDFGQLSSVIN
jgi:hypothetical protein